MAIFTSFAVCGYAIGVPTAIHSVTRARTAEGAIAWAVSLITLPWLAVPLYWLFGRDRFRGYRKLRRSREVEVGTRHSFRAGDRSRPGTNFLAETLPEVATQGPAGPGPAAHGSEVPAFEAQAARLLERLAGRSFTQGNTCQLLVDGAQTFDAIFEAIDSAQVQLLVQFYIVRDDPLGRRILDRLRRRVAAGVEVRFLYDEIGSHALSARFIGDARDAGIDLRPFNSTRRSRFQLNFRNHRKLVVADGRNASLGGHNVGEEYLGNCPTRGRWRDTHLAVEGPAVRDLALAFIEDWHWATGCLLECPSADFGARPGQQMLVFSSGPSDPRQTLGLFFVQLANMARQRLWITTPYFVPDAAVLRALELAALRGVDVRVLLPRKPDHPIVALSSLWYLDRLKDSGLRVFRFSEGFLHQKVILVDDRFSTVGSANLDNRSLHLNFELTALVVGPDFAGEIERMLQADFEESIEVAPGELGRKTLKIRLAAAIARLFSPLQ